eukprot:m.50724 g.50724  ORF g.50724 m.50724 type:complete len:1013 (+) comp34089_c0_seq2:31-3069(+)
MSEHEFQRSVSASSSRKVNTNRLGHQFQKKSFRRITFCHHCTDMLWGIVNQGYQCQNCNFVSHDRCMPVVVTVCTSKEAPAARDPVPHTWSRAGIFRKEFCRVCRRRLEDGYAVQCEVCRYFAHEACQDGAANNCRKCATFSPSADEGCFSELRHHWIEGDVSPGETCVHCFKDCGTNDCLSSVRCSWCGRPAHSGCYQFLCEFCDFGVMLRLVVPPHCVSLSLTGIDTEWKTQSRRSHFLQSRLLPGNASENGDECFSHSEDDLDNPNDVVPGLHVLRIFDGSGIRAHETFKTIAVSESATVGDALEAALAKFKIRNDQGGYYLSERVTETDEERKLAPELSLDDVIKSRAGDPLTLHLMTDELEGDKGIIRVYPGMQGFSGRLNFKAVSVSQSTTAEEVIKLALKKLKLKNESPREYSLVQVSLHKGVKETVLDKDACPWEILTTTKMLSLREVHMTRFYLRKDSEIMSSCLINVFVGNLPKHRTEDFYRQTLKSILGDADKETQIGSFFPAYGCMFVEFYLPDTAARSMSVLKQAVVEKEKLKVILLPYIEASALLTKTSPLLIFVNTKSGGGQGLELFSLLRQHLNPYQVFNVLDGGPFPGFMTFCNVPDFRLLICGGDGTCGWVLTALDDVRGKLKCKYPPSALLPIGTGNDLARVLRWGPGYSGDESIIRILMGVEEAETSVMDRWTIIFDSTPPAMTLSSRLHNITHRPSPPEARRMFEETRATSMLSRELAKTSLRGKSDAVNDSSRPIPRRRAFTDEGDSPKIRKARLAATEAASASASASVNPPKFHIMNSYLGIGIEADIALGFHNAREEAPEKFNSRFHNKGVYVRMSLSKMVSKGNCSDLQRRIRLECDGKEKRLPSDLEGLIVLNIGSWGSGAEPWGSEKHDGFLPPRINDGLLEIVGVTGVMHLAQIQGKVRSGIRLAQCSHVKLFLNETLPVQVDGEPWLQESCTVVITRCSEWATMLMRSKKSSYSKKYPHQSPVLRRSPRVIKKTISASGHSNC